MLGLEHSTAGVMYKDADSLVEKYCKMILFTAMLVLLQGLMIPKFVFVYLIYFTTDTGNDAFEMGLPFPYWSVRNHNSLSIIFFVY